MSRFEMKAYEPQKIQFELSVVMTLEDWKKVRDALLGSPAYGPTGQMKDAIQEMIDQANKTFRAWPEEKVET